MTSFSQQYETTIRTLEAKLSELIDNGAALDFTRSGDVLTIEFEDGEKIVITPQSPMQQLWISANYAGYRFNWSEEKNEWVDEKGGEELNRFLASALRNKLGDSFQL